MPVRKRTLFSPSEYVARLICARLRLSPGGVAFIHLVIVLGCVLASGVTSAVPVANAVFTIHSGKSGNWSDANTWAEHRIPRANDFVQVRAGDRVIYDVASDEPIRMIHVAGVLSFARDRSTRLTVGVIKIQACLSTSENGFDCDAVDHSPRQADSTGTATSGDTDAAMELGTLEDPIPAQFTSTIRLKYFEGADAETTPAIIACGGRWDVHGAPMNRTWVKLGANAIVGANTVSFAEKVTGWQVGDRVFITSSKLDGEVSRSFRTKDADSVQTEERIITAIDDQSASLDAPLKFAHRGNGEYRSEIANLSRNVVIESADPSGVRGHTMYHRHSSGSISYAEFRHLGKQSILGKYAIHFHLCHESMRGSGVVGASIWDSANRWVTIHGTNHLLVRDCVGYGSIGHGFFLEDGTEAYNVLDRNLAVHAFKGKPLPKQALNFDTNDGAGFWWAAGRNSLVRNVSCENDQYGFHYDHSEGRRENTSRDIEQADGSTASMNIRAIPFYRFEDNESHCDGLYSFNIGADRNGAVHGDKQHPFICRNLRSWETHYAFKPLLSYLLVDGLKMVDNVYGVYHPDYDAHVYRNIYLNHVVSEPINRGHDDEDNQYGDFTYENLTLENCGGTLIQLTSTSPRTNVSGHFRNVIVKDVRKYPHDRATVDLGTGTMNPKLQEPVVYYFHDLLQPGQAMKVVSLRFAQLYDGPEYHAIPDFTGRRVKATEVSGVAFPQLLDPIDDLPPATMIRSIRETGTQWLVTGITSDNGEVALVTVNGIPATITASACGVVDWQITVAHPSDGKVIALAKDAAGNVEKIGHAVHRK